MSGLVTDQFAKRNPSKDKNKKTTPDQKSDKTKWRSPISGVRWTRKK